jgi:hypothetical protein
LEKFMGFIQPGMGKEMPDPKKTAAETTERKTDRFDQMIFSFLAVLYPSPGNDQNDRTPLSRFDVDPPKAVISMLAHSKVLDKAAELLRNDSLENATQRKDMYMAFILFRNRKLCIASGSSFQKPPIC